MKKALFVLLMALSQLCNAENLPPALHNIELEWAKVYYEQPKTVQVTAYPALLDKVAQLNAQYPHDAGVLYWQALTKASNAAHQNPMHALKAVHEVRDLLTQVITINPKVMNGAAYVVLGTLYDKTPPWPIAFGDETIAKKMLETALKINPNGVAGNYFYGKFLLDHDDKTAAEHYFHKAMTAAVRPEQPYPDIQLQHKAEHALKKMHGDYVQQ
jgi:tetratricopeptide (TPR) repeat protein